MSDQIRRTRIHLVSESLAVLFPGQGCGPCACSGVDCLNPSDARWWSHLLQEYDREDIVRMVAAYRVARLGL